MTYHTRCFAKINLKLKIGPVASTGYHPLETEFLTVSLFDDLFVTLGEAGISVQGDPIPAENTLTKTLRLASEAMSLPRIKIHLEKRIPSQAGLGGGSSDSAGLLRVLRKIVPPLVPNYEFEAIAKSVGADVTFFLQGGHALGSGYGERIRQQPDRPGFFVLAFPPVGCRTPELYRKLDDFRSDSFGSFQTTSLPKNCIENDFHAVMPTECTACIQAMDERNPIALGLSGSGSTVFGEFDTLALASRAGESLNAAGINALTVQSVSQQDATQVSRT